jgi:hypothetical protein
MHLGLTSTVELQTLLDSEHIPLLLRLSYHTYESLLLSAGEIQGRLTSRSMTCIYISLVADPGPRRWIVASFPRSGLRHRCGTL